MDQIGSGHISHLPPIPHFDYVQRKRFIPLRAPFGFGSRPTSRFALSFWHTPSGLLRCWGYVRFIWMALESAPKVRP